MSHTSGMPDEDDYGWNRPEFDEQSLERYVKSVAGLKLHRNPGDHFAYSNIGYEILGDVIAKVSGMTFEQYMRKYVLEPIGMQSSSFLKQEITILKCAAIIFPESSSITSRLQEYEILS